MLYYACSISHYCRVPYTCCHDSVLFCCLRQRDGKLITGQNLTTATGIHLPERIPAHHLRQFVSMWNMWYFWFMVIFVFFVCFGGCGFYKRRSQWTAPRSRHRFSTSHWSPGLGRRESSRRSCGQSEFSQSVSSSRPAAHFSVELAPPANIATPMPPNQLTPSYEPNNRPPTYADVAKQQPSRPGGRQQRQQQEDDTEMMLQQSQQYGTFEDEQMEQQQQQQGGGGGRGGGGGGSGFSLTEQPKGQEENYRQWLVVNFKDSFDEYEQDGGMPITIFHTMIKEKDIGRRRRLTELFKRLDADGNSRVSWTEFYDGLTYKKKTEIRTSKKVVNKIVKRLAPAAKRKVKQTKKEAAEDGEPIPEDSYLEAYNCRPPPLFMPIFFIACWVVFIVYAVELNRGPAWNHVTWEFGLPFYSPLAFCPSVRQQVWRFLSYSLLHNGYHHIVFNTVMGLLLGVPLETVHKAWRVVPVFVIGAIAGSLASSIIDPAIALVGASGGVYSLIGAHYALVIMNWEEMQHEWLKCRSNPLKFLLSGVMRLVYLTIFIAIDFGIAAYKRYFLPIKVPMSVSAHIGGMLAGLLVGAPVLRNIDKKPWEGIVAIVSLIVAITLAVFAVLWNIFYRGFPNPETVACSNPSLVD